MIRQTKLHGIQLKSAHKREEEATATPFIMNNNMKAGTKITFDAAQVIQPIYTGGQVSASENGKILATTLGEEVLLTNLTTGAQLARIEGVSLSQSPQIYSGLTLTKFTGR